MVSAEVKAGVIWPDVPHITEHGGVVNIFGRIPYVNEYHAPSHVFDMIFPEVGNCIYTSLYYYYQTKDNLVNFTGMGEIFATCLEDALAKNAMGDLAYPYWSDPRTLVQANKLIYEYGPVGLPGQIHVVHPPTQRRNILP